MRRRVGVVGGGGFGLGLARSAARVGRRVSLWTRQRNLDTGDASIDVVHGMEELVDCEVVFLAVPSVHMEATAHGLGEHLDGRHLLVHVSRGLLGPDLMTVSELLKRATPCRRVGALAGPLVARSLLEGEPGGGIVGSRFPEVAAAVRAAIGGPKLRIYSTDDVVGVEAGSAFVGLLALALGYAQGLGLGPSTLAVLVTRGMVEAARVGMVLGAVERTFQGLAGFGDLLAAVAGDRRPEILLGRALAGGAALTDAALQAGAYVEGVSIARNVTAFAERCDIDVPLAGAIAQVLEGDLTPARALERLMARPVGPE